MSNEQKGQELESKADKLIDNGCWKKTEYQMADIADLYSKAANFYKMAKNRMIEIFYNLISNRLESS
jgi:hypothetical protein